MKKSALLIFSLVLGFAVQAQSDSASKPFRFDFHGFVNPHFYADSRSVVGGREEMMLFYPKPVLLDSLGRDTYDGWNANMLAITTRLGLRVTGPDMLGAKSSAYVEGDFTGATNATINNLRLRHAYIDLRWQHHRVLTGQYWHPMVVHEIMPMTNPLNMGAPFHPYSRQPQVRYEFNIKHFEAVGVAVWQLDNTSQGLLNGTVTSSTAFARHSLLPELNLQLRYKSERTLIGIAYNIKNLQPVVPDPNGKLMRQPTFSLFGSYNGKSVVVRAQTLIHNTLYEIASMGGYTLIYNNVTGNWGALDETFTTVWLDLERNRGHWRPGLFCGLAFNSTPSYDIAYDPNDRFFYMGRGHDIAGLWRIQPRLTYKTLKGLDFTGEAEYTQAYYVGTGEGVGNLRLSLSIVYAF